jgi:hypothetical protein
MIRLEINSSSGYSLQKYIEEILHYLKFYRFFNGKEFSDFTNSKKFKVVISHYL